MGESYAGHYVPAICNKIVGENRKGGFQIPLVGMAIGNGLTDPLKQYPKYNDYFYDNGLISKLDYEVLKLGWAECDAAIASKVWPIALEICNLHFENSMTAAALHLKRSVNVYNWKERCADPPLCYNFSNIDAFLARSDVRTALGIPEHVQWSECNMGVHLEFLDDWMENLISAVQNVLNAKVRTLVYEGTNDIICNWYGALNWVQSLNYPGFAAAPNTTLTTDNNTSGYVKTASDLTFAMILNAGHMVPRDQPAVALQMINDLFLFK
jgi:carboxypeptidase C (cathepsin A)